jgi:2-polyprenyl-6-methoxyphenol hydroxylase-like FAD-dependent oxidoreductase
MSEMNVLVVGSSIAGPTAAYWLSKAGCKVTVIERFPQLRTNGQSVDIRTVGVTVMRRMEGLEEEVLAKTTSINGISFVGSDGRRLGTIARTGDPDQQSLVSEYEIFRGDLSRILYDKTKDEHNIKYVFGEQVTSLKREQEDGPIIVEFMNGHPTSTFDLVVACDGATSRTRAMGLDCDARDYIESMNGWATFFSTKRDILEKTDTVLAYSAPGGRLVVGGPDPSGINRVTFMAMNQSNAHMNEFREVAKQGEKPLKDFVANRYVNAGWKADEAVKEMIESEDFYGTELMHVKTPILYKGHFVLVGDAGYAAPTGTGTSLAMCGAYVLAGEIGRNKDNLTEALKAYEEVMRPIIDEHQKTPSFFSTAMAPQTTWGIWIRNTIFSFICWSGIIQFTQKYLAGAFSSSDTYNLPEYQMLHNTIN